MKQALQSAMAALLLTMGATPGLASAAESGPAQQLIVKFREGGLATALERTAWLRTQGRAQGLELRALREVATGGQVIRLQGRRLEAAELQTLLATLAADPLVEYAEEDRLLKPLLTPNDSRYNEQWHYFEATGGLNAPAAWDITTGAGVVVGVLDTGYRPHVDLAGNIVGGYDFISDTFVSVDGNGRDSDATDPGDWYSNDACGAGSGSSSSSWHGTHVAGTIAALTNNGSGVAGVAFGAKVLPLRVLGRCGGYTSDIADAMIWGSGGSVSGLPANPNPAKVLNLSLGGGGACDATSQAAINSARSRGTVVIVAAGNENQNASNSSPANCTGVVTVAATNRSGGRAYYSNFGTVVDVAAPGGAMSSATDPNGVLSTYNSGTQGPGSDSYAFSQGTSMATPHVAGVAALMHAVKPGITPDEVESLLKSTSRSFPATCSGCGSGIVNALAAVQGAQGGGTPPPPTSTTLSNGVPVTGLSGAAGTELRFTLQVPSGASNLSFQMSGGSGDADLYVRFGTAPTTTSYDCRPYLGGNAETCTFATPQVGTYHVMVRGYSSFSGVSLVGSYTAASSGSCAAGFTAYTGSLSSGASQYWTSTSGYTSSVSGTHSGRLTGPGSADFDLYLQKRNTNGSWSNVGSGTGSTSTESIDYNGTAGTYRYRVYAYSGSGSYQLCIKRP
ncbi:MAG TPA: S8 family peptidase [Nevskiaceae bacterium]|nr:S8 family peptidase [Nevskiaceae bacterium]